MADARAFEYSAGFQNRMLRVLFQDPQFTCTIGLCLDPKLFDGRIRQWMASILMTHAKKHGVGASLDAVQIALRRDLHLRRLQPADEASADALILKLQRPVADRSFVKEEIFRFAKNQVVRDVIMHSLDHLDRLDFESIDREFSRVTEMTALASGGLGHFYVRDVESRLETRKKVYEKNGIPTGTRLDDFIKFGGLWPKSLGCVVGGYARGKTSSLVSMSRAAIIEGGKRVLYVTLDESDEAAICDRFDAGFIDVSLTDLANEDDLVRQTVEELGTKYGEFLVVKEFPPATLTVPLLRSYLRTLEMKAFYPDLIVVDYADYMLPTVTAEKTYESQGNVYIELRGLLIEKNVAGWTAAQLNREGMRRDTADGSFVGESIKKPQVCDLMVVLNQTAQEKKAKIGRLWVDKNRGGPAQFELPVRMDWARQLLSDRN